MPYYKFECLSCGREGKRFFIKSSDILDCRCEFCEQGVRKIPGTPMEPTVFEVKGTHQQRRVLKNIGSIMKDRAHVHVRDRGEAKMISETQGEVIAERRNLISKKYNKIKSSLDEK